MDRKYSFLIKMCVFIFLLNQINCTKMYKTYNLIKANKLDHQVIKLFNQGQYQKAIPIARKALYIRAKILDQEHPLVAISFNNLAQLYYKIGDYDEAELLFERALAIRKKKLNPEHLDIAESLNNLALLYQDKGAYGQALPLSQRALKIREANLAADHPDLAQSYNNLATLYQDMGVYSQAEPLFQRTLRILEAKLGPDHLDIAIILNNLAMLYQMMGAYDQAEQFHLRALKIREAKLAADHPEVAQSINNLAELYRAKGAYSQAESLCQRALKIWEAKLGPNHPYVAIVLNNLALLYHDTGAYGQAEPLYQRALKIRELQLGPDHVYVATSLNNLAELYRDMGAYSQAEPLYQRALKIQEAQLGPEHPDVATVINNLALLYHNMGTYGKAESYLQQALKIREEQLGPDNPYVATSLNNLAELYRAMGAYSQAEPLYQRALKIYEAKLGSEHPYVAQSLNNIIYLWGALGNFDKIIPVSKRLLQLNFHHYHIILFYLSEKRQLDYIQKNFPLSHLWLSLYQKYGQQSAEFKLLTSEVLLNQKGILYEILARRRQLQKPGGAALKDSLNSIRTQLANAYFTDLDAIKTSEQHLHNIQWLQAQQERMETQLVRQGYEPETQKTPIVPAKLCQALPEDYTLMDFWYFYDYNFIGEQKALSDLKYLAVVYQKNQEPEIFQLGKVHSLHKNLSELFQAIFMAKFNTNRTKQQHLTAEAMIKAKGQQLYRQLFQPLLSAMGEKKKVIICADGALHYLPFGVLVDEQNRYLVESYQFHYVSTSRDILKWGKIQGPSNKNALIMAKSKFQQKEQELKHSLAEAMAIDSLLKRNNFSTKLKLEDQATESVLKSAKSPRILHISTHGFFKPAPEEPRPARELAFASFQTTIRRGLVENPLLRSGLILTGTNPADYTQTVEDGIATALEIAGLDLAETDLVTLSACVTGIGDLKSGEGLYGLHRSFLLAGAKTVLASLWSVPDLETKDLMVEFYQRYLSDPELTKSEALRQAQLAVIKNLLEKYGAAPPAYWGAFICIGEP